MVTPFLDQSDKGVDYDSLERIFEHLIQGGVDYVVLQGTTGETPTLREEEKRQLVSTIYEINRKRVPLVLGITGNNTRQLALDFARASESGMDGILCAAPAYNKPNQYGLYQHYHALAEATELPLILYNVPGRTSSNLQAETTLALAREKDNIVAIKEASADFTQCMQIITRKPDGFVALSGEDALALPLIALGFEGVISVTSNAFPEAFSKMIGYALDSDMLRAQQLHYRLFPFMRLAFADGNPAGIKQMLKQRGFGDNALRLPLVEVHQEVRKQIYDALHRDTDLR